MAKCVRCGGSFLTRFKIKLKDAYICRQCTLELGFDKDFYLRSSLYSWDDIKDGRDAYYLKKKKQEIKDAVISSISVTMKGGQRRELICTEEEREIFDEIRNIFRSFGFDDSGLELVRVSDNYVTVKAEPWDVARIKFSSRAKWVLFPSCESEKHYIESPEDVQDFDAQIRKTIEIINKYSDSPVPRL